ncbi:unnamed protein product, partial [Polarella glacialis]
MVPKELEYHHLEVPESAHNPQLQLERQNSGCLRLRNKELELSPGCRHQAGDLDVALQNLDPVMLGRSDCPTDMITGSVPPMTGGDPGPALEEKLSGHSMIRRARFASAIFGPLASFTAVTFARDVYTLQMGADPQPMGVLMLLAAVWLPICSPLAGYIMDRDLLTRCFPMARWGRRAPWFLIHLLMLSLVAIGCFLPPSQNSQMLSYWVFINVIVGSWCLAVCFTAWEAARPEIYPSTNERVCVEFFCKIFAGVGSATAGLIISFLLRNASFPVRLPVSLLLFVLTICSLQSVPVLTDANTVS